MVTTDEFALRLKNDCLLAPGTHVLAAVSGGADSVALLRLLDALRDTYPLALSCAHVEHGIRGDSSLCDMEFVRLLCQERKIPFYCTQVDAPSYAEKSGCGVEAAARELRYAFLRKTMNDVGADCIALAHHADDQAETVLLHALRGSDLHGLCAMRARLGDLIRPLLGFDPLSLRAYLLQIGQQWREDASNSDIRYARNRIRHRVLPEFEVINPEAGRALCRLAQAAQRDDDFFESQIEALNLCMLPLVDGGAVRREQIKNLHPALLGRVIVKTLEFGGAKPQSTRTIDLIMDAIVSGDAATINLEGGAYARLGRGYLCVQSAKTPEVDVPLSGLCTDTPFGRVYLRDAKSGETGDGVISQAVPKRLIDGARITNRRDGDTMVPFGMSSSVKLKKLLIDAGIDQGIKASIPVLRSRDGKILWVIGLRPDECCRGKDNEEKIIVEMRPRDVEC